MIGCSFTAKMTKNAWLPSPQPAHTPNCSELSCRPLTPFPLVCYTLLPNLFGEGGAHMTTNTTQLARQSNAFAPRRIAGNTRNIANPHPLFSTLYSSRTPPPPPCLICNPWKCKPRVLRSKTRNTVSCCHPWQESVQLTNTNTIPFLLKLPVSLIKSGPVFLYSHSRSAHGAVWGKDLTQRRGDAGGHSPLTPWGGKGFRSGAEGASVLGKKGLQS
jgi:hypothetical protein